MTVRDYRQYLFNELRHETGIPRCAACDGAAKVYNRHINAGMAKSLIEIYFAMPEGIRGRDLNMWSREWGKLVYWGLAREVKDRWYLTHEGFRWVKDQTRVPYSAYVYNNNVLERTGPPWSVREALRKKFDYDELMGNR